MKKEVLLDIPLEDKPGTLKPIINCLAESKINIIAIMVFSRGALVVVNKPDKAMNVFRNYGIDYNKEDVIVGELPNKPGAFYKTIDNISSLRVNIDFAYATTQPDSNKTLCVFSTNDNDRALQFLK